MCRLQSPPLGKSAKSNDYQEQQHEDPPSPYYNCLSKYQNGLQEQLKQDPAVDVPDTGVKYFQYNPRPVPNPAYNDHIPTNLGQPSPKSPHQTSLPRSLTNYQQGEEIKCWGRGVVMCNCTCCNKVIACKRYIKGRETDLKAQLGL